MLKKIFLSLFLFSSLFAKEFTCVNCEEVLKTKAKFHKIYASSPSLLYALYSFDKTLPIGLNFEFFPIEKKYLDEKFYNLPVVGGFFGQGKVPNIEMLLNLKPDLILSPPIVLQNPKFANIFDRLKIPSVYIEDQDIFDTNLYKFFGEIFENQKRADELIAFGLKSMELSKKIKSLHLPKLSVYYAFGKDGLQTECASSSFIKLIDLAGGDTQKFACKSQKNAKRVKANFEEILSKNPDVILVYHKEFYDQIFHDKRWKLLKAVQEKRVFLIPRSPFSWVGKPASFTKILGFLWLVKNLHGDKFDIDIRKNAKEFYKTFFYTDLSEEDLDFILNEKN